MPDDRAHVLDMLHAARAIRRFVGGRTQESFLTDEMLQSAVLHKFTVLGEACRRVSADYRQATPGVDWVGIGGFRNKIVHDYDEIDLDIVWDIAERDLQTVIAALEPLVPKESDAAEG